MKRVYRGGNLADTAHLKNLLEQEGIESFIKNLLLGGGVGDLPPTEIAPELWVFRDEQAERASTVIREALNAQPAPASAAWRCTRCGETNEGQFAACWRCGTSAPA